jgi:hypothetical protein
MACCVVGRGGLTAAAVAAVAAVVVAAAAVAAAAAAAWPVVTLVQSLLTIYMTLSLMIITVTLSPSLRWNLFA